MNVTHLSRRARLTTGALALTAVGFGVFGVAAAASGSPAAAPAAPVNVSARATTETTHLSEASALRAAQAALTAAEKAGQHVSVAVVDRDGRVLVQLRGDASGPQSFESAELKAYTAVSWNAPTSVLAGRLAQTPTLKDIPGTLFLAGAVPVDAKGAPIAGVGVAGAPSGNLDEEFAAAGAAALR